jgi:hypothetical protein
MLHFRAELKLRCTKSGIEEWKHDLSARRLSCAAATGGSVLIGRWYYSSRSINVAMRLETQLSVCFISVLELHSTGVRNQMAWSQVRPRC